MSRPSASSRPGSSPAPLCRHLFHARRADAPGRAAPFSAEVMTMMDFSAFFDQLWIARIRHPEGAWRYRVDLASGDHCRHRCSASSSAWRSIYGDRVAALVVRGYTDFIRGTPVLVLVLASYYVLSHHRHRAWAVPGRRSGAGDLLLFACRRDRARRACRRSPRGRPKPPRRSG